MHRALRRSAASLAALPGPLLLALCALTGAPAPAQNVTPNQPGPVARFTLDGRPAFVTREEYALSVASRHRRSESGAEVVKLLIDRHLVETEARAKNIEAPPARLRERTQQIVDRLKAAGRTLESQLASMGIDEATFRRDYLVSSVLHEQLVRDEMGLAADAQVTPDLLQLWLQEARLRHEVVTDLAGLPPGVVARVDDREFTDLDLGLALAPKLTDEQKERFVRRVVLRRSMTALARSEGIEVTDTETRAEVAKRRKRIESNPRYRGVSFEDWLSASQGMTPEELAASPALVATVQLAKLMERRYPPEKLRERLESDRDAVLAKHGETRRISLLLLRAADETNEIVSRKFPEAEAELQAIAAQLDKPGMTFDKLARVHSEDPYSKVRGGDLGYQPREGQLPPELAAAAFDMQLLEVRGPLRVEHGMCLVRLTGIRPAPPESELLGKLREDLGQELLRKVLEDAAIELQ